jgi:hypothetical protein
MKHFFDGFEKKASCALKTASKFKSWIDANRNRAKTSMKVLAAPAVAYGGYKAFDKTFGAPDPVNDF